MIQPPTGGPRVSRGHCMAEVLYKSFPSSDSEEETERQRNNLCDLRFGSAPPQNYWRILYGRKDPWISSDPCSRNPVVKRILDLLRQ